MTVQHKDQAGTDLHEPKGVAAGTIAQVYHADGAGSGVWKIANPSGGWRYQDIGTGATFTTPTTYTLMNVAGVTTTLSDFTNNSLGRLTYTGTADIHVHLVLDLAFKHSTGGGQDIFFDFYKNGTTATAENVVSADSADYKHAALHFDTMLSTNDYIELYLKASSGSVVVHTAYMFMMGMAANG